jgi:hypothetical protein
MADVTDETLIQRAKEEDKLIDREEMFNNIAINEDTGSLKY